MNSKVTLIAALTVSCTASFIIGRAWSGANHSSSSDSPEQHLTGPGAQGGNMRGPRANGQSSARPGNRTARGEYQAASQAGSILSNPDSLARAQAWAQYLRGLSPDQFEDAAQGLRQTGMTMTRAHELSILMNAWATQDPLSAMAYVDKEDLGVSNRQAVLAGWAGIDPEAAIEWAKHHEKPRHGSPLMLGVIQGLAGTDPDRATQLMEEMPRSVERSEAAVALHSHYLMQGPATVREWAMSFEDGPLRQGAIAIVANSLAITDPKGTADWLLANSDKVPGHAISNAVARLAKSDPQAAIAYFDQIEASDSHRRSALKGISRELAKSDPQAALDLLDANADLQNSEALLAIAMDNRKTNPEISNQARERIQDPALRALADGHGSAELGEGTVFYTFPPEWKPGQSMSSHGFVAGEAGDSTPNSNDADIVLPSIELYKALPALSEP